MMPRYQYTLINANTSRHGEKIKRPLLPPSRKLKVQYRTNTVTYCTVSCTTSHRTVQTTVPHPTVPFRIVPHRTAPYRIVPYHTCTVLACTPKHDIPYRVPYRASYRTVLYRTVPYLYNTLTFLACTARPEISLGRCLSGHISSSLPPPPPPLLPPPPAEEVVWRGGRCTSSQSTSTAVAAVVARGNGGLTRPWLEVAVAEAVVARGRGRFVPVRGFWGALAVALQWDGGGGCIEG